MATTINCPFCGKLTDPKLDNCVHCGGFLQSQEGADQKKGDARSQTCPSCGALVREGDIICVACGTNLLTGQKIAEEKALPESVERSVPWGIIGLVTAGIVVVGLGVGAVFLFRNPVDRARRLAAENRRTEAAELLTKYVTSHPERGDAHYELGRLHFDFRDYEAAADSFEKAFDYMPEKKEAALFAALSHARGEEAGAIDRQVSVLRKLTKRFPNDGQAAFLLALALGAQGDSAGQLDALRNARGAGVSAGDLSETQGIASALQGDYEQARSQLSQAVLANPGNADTQLLETLVDRLSGNGTASTGDLEALANKSSTLQEEALTQLGLRLVTEGRFLEAEDYLREVIAMGNPAPSVRFYHAVCLQARGQNQDALRELELLADMNNAISGHAGVHAAQIHLALGSRDRAVTALTKASRKEGVNQAAVDTVRGRIAVLEGNDAEAREAFRRAIGRDPSYAPARLENGLWYIRNAVTAEGIRELEQYLALVDENDPNARALEVGALVSQLRQSMSPGGAGGDTVAGVAGEGRS
ncbi:MAG: tetratricopeptide repeat protein [bacterium]|nr:tetratricopeptide repeat protein [bacterium]